MEEFMPLEMIKNNFKTDIHRLEISSKSGHVALYQAETSFGQMTLIVQSFMQREGERADKASHRSIVQRISQRNKLIASQDIVTPLIYEQQTIKMREDYIICMTLCQPVVISNRQDLIQMRIESLFQNLVKCAYKISRTNLAYQLDSYHLNNFMQSTLNSSFFLDFTRIDLDGSCKDEEVLERFKLSLCEMMRLNREERMQEVIFICESPCLFNLQRIAASESWFDLAMLFNLLQQDKVTLITEARSKLVPVSKLTGVVKIQYQGNIYSNLTFRDGFRMDGVRELTFQDLKTRFFEDKMIYYMTKEKYMCVRKEAVEKEEWLIRKIDYEDIIYVRPEINKVEFINFLIAYIKFIEPILHELNFFAEENILQLVFTNKLKKIMKVAIKFHHRYVVKDQELSMIIEKSKLKKASICLEKMSFGDSFLIFLANCDKMVNVRSFNISYCSKITDSGLNLLVGSQYCKNLTVLKICSLPLPDFDIVKSNLQLKELYINDCVPYEVGEEVSLSELGIQRLEAIGVAVNFKLADSVKYLSINQDATLQQLKMLSKLSLVELKIKLVESKKSISNFLSTINSFYTKDNPVKVFCQGNSKKTLKSLDISHSTIKLKDIKPIFSFQTLQTLICQYMQRQKFLDISLPHHIISLSLKGSKITSQILQEMTHRINFFIRLNIHCTDITEHTLQQSIKNKKYINLLEIGEEQISLKFFSKKSCVQGVEVHLHKLIRDDNQAILNYILFKQVNICKELNFRCQQKYQPRLVRKISRFLTLYQQNLRSIASELTLNVNSIPILKLINLKVGENSHEYFTAITKKPSHKVKLDSHTLLAQQYRLPFMEQYISIDLFNVALHKVLQLHPLSLLQISIRSNRILSKDVISLINKYAGSRLKALDFRNCLFSYSQVQQQLYSFPYLQSVNEGEYQIVILQEDQCQAQLQKILKFFMKLNQQDKMKLKLHACSISQKQLYFSIIYEIIHHHSANIVMLQINFQNIAVDHQSQQFWKKVFLLEKLETFHLRYVNDFECKEADEMNIAVQFEKLVDLNLFSFEIETSIPLIIPDQLSFKDIRRLSLNYSEMEINESAVTRILKGTPTLHHLAVKLQNCNVTSVARISDCLQRMANLVHLSLNFQNSPVKENSLFELIDSLHKNSLLQRFELNINNVVICVNDLVKVCEGLINRLKFCHVVIYALQQLLTQIRARRPAFFRDHAELLTEGIQLIFTY